MPPGVRVLPAWSPRSSRVQGLQVEVQGPVWVGVVVWVLAAIGGGTFYEKGVLDIFGATFQVPTLRNDDDEACSATIFCWPCLPPIEICDGRGLASAGRDDHLVVAPL